MKARHQSFTSVEMAADRGQHATLFFLTEQGRGWHSFTWAALQTGLRFI